MWRVHAERAADGPGMGQPRLAVAVDEAVALGAGVVLVEHGSPPGDHLLLHLHGARRGRMHRDPQRAQVVPLPHLVRQLQHPHEHRRHPLAVGGVVALDEHQGLLGVEVLHDDDRAPELVDAEAEPERRGVVQRGGRQVDGVGLDPEEHRQQPADGGQVLAQRLVGRRSLHPLGPARGAGRVEHVGPGDAVGERFGGLTGDGVLVRLVALDDPVEHEPQLDVGRLRKDLSRLLGLGAGGDEGAGRAVVDDVGQLGVGQSGRASGVHEPGVVAAPDHLEVAGMVLHADRDVVARAQAGGVEELAQPVGPGVELGVGRHGAGLTHDHGGLVGCGRGMSPWEHDRRT